MQRPPLLVLGLVLVLAVAGCAGPGPEQNAVRAPLRVLLQAAAQQDVQAFCGVWTQAAQQQMRASSGSCAQVARAYFPAMNSGVSPDLQAGRARIQIQGDVAEAMLDGGTAIFRRGPQGWQLEALR